MIIPLKDNIPSLSPPYINYSIIAMNFLAFLWELSWGPYFPRLVEALGFVPARFLALLWQGQLPLLAFIPAVTAIFLHGGWLHLIGNMWFLYIFGDNVEDVLGHGRYFFLYLFCGVAANFIYLMFAPSSIIPLVGASGAIAGVMGAYFSLFPGARVLTLVIIVIFPLFLELPAYFFLGLWFLLQFLFGTFASVSLATQRGGVAWWAHVGGFLVGIWLLRLFKPHRARKIFLRL